jgi:erythritol kinase (D-erythritol 1-phosphate-forming)
MKDIIIGIDAGTSVIKSVAFDLDGKQIAAHAIANRYVTVPGSGAEQEMDRTWDDAAATLRGLSEKIPVLAARTAAIAVTGQGDGTWLINKSGRPVMPAWLWLDARAAALVDELRAAPDDRTRYIETGTGLAACQQGPQLRWMMRHAPHVLEQSTTAFHCKDWLYFNLTGERATDPSEGLFTFGRFADRTYSQEVIEILGLTEVQHLIPPMVDGVQTSFPLTSQAAKVTGLTQGTPIVLGYVDVACTALGAGIFDPERTPGVTIVGSTGMHMRFVPDAKSVQFNDDRTGYTMAMPVPGAYAQMQSNMASTLNIDWILQIASDVLNSQNAGVSRDVLLGQMDQWVREAAPGALIYQPYISEAGERGPFVDGNARAGFVGLSSGHHFADLVRSVFEGLAFAARDCYTATGTIPLEVRLTGGAARSMSLRKILGACIGADIRTSSREEAGAAGAAMMAAVSIGAFGSMEDCAARWVTPLLGEAEQPDAALAEVYSRLYPAYVAARSALRPVWKEVSRYREHTQ